MGPLSTCPRSCCRARPLPAPSGGADLSNRPLMRSKALVLYWEECGVFELSGVLDEA